MREGETSPDQATDREAEVVPLFPGYGFIKWVRAANGDHVGLCLKCSALWRHGTLPSKRRQAIEKEHLAYGRCARRKP